jgi:hypothetical protein
VDIIPVYCESNCNSINVEPVSGTVRTGTVARLKCVNEMHVKSYAFIFLCGVFDKAK